MAPSSISLQVLLLALAILFICSANADPDHKLKETNMQALDIQSIRNALVTDDPIIEGPDLNSAAVGHAQGIYVTSRFDGMNTHVMMSIVFTNNAYNGSTLEIQGTSKQFEVVREVAVVSGTGKFRFAREYATFENYFMDVPSAYTVIRCNVTILHY
ncbi:Dirigent protein [Melia azedarach]|uniref:Dirigent protein n=1 Tax=Melia azedarach TaxID=155640 RepID=A0ACC1Z2D6_MELAZ|nr:Dirigent protein [Melia azedarach]